MWSGKTYFKNYISILLVVFLLAGEAESTDQCGLSQLLVERHRPLALWRI